MKKCQSDCQCGKHINHTKSCLENCTCNKHTQSPETIAKRVESRRNGKGWAHSEEYKVKLSISQKGRPISTQQRYRVSESLKLAYAEGRRKPLIIDICPLCDREKPIHVDHDHISGVIRGRICQNCNMALGHVADNIETLRNMIAYLQGDLAKYGVLMRIRNVLS